jgi:hypothetical protein
MAADFESGMMRLAMKLKAPEGVGDPCVAGVILTSRGGCYEVEPEVGTLLIECFGFMPVGAHVSAAAVLPSKPRRRRAARKSASTPG